MFAILVLQIVRANKFVGVPKNAESEAAKEKRLSELKKQEDSITKMLGISIVTPPPPMRSKDKEHPPPDHGGVAPSEVDDPADGRLRSPGRAPSPVTRVHMSPRVPETPEVPKTPGMEDLF